MKGFSVVILKREATHINRQYFTQSPTYYYLSEAENWKIKQFFCVRLSKVWPKHLHRLVGRELVAFLPRLISNGKKFTFPLHSQSQFYASCFTFHVNLHNNKNTNAITEKDDFSENGTAKE